MATFAGRWSDTFTGGGRPIPFCPVQVVLRGTTIGVPIYTDRTKAVVASASGNVVCDALGNGTFLAEPGDLYDLISADIRVPVSVPADPLEPDPGREIRYAENVTGVGTIAAATNPAYDIPGCAFAVTPSPQPGSVEGECQLYQYIVGTGLLWLIVYEVVAGVSTAKYWSIVELPNRLNAYMRVRVVRRLGVVAATRDLKLSVKMTATTGGPGVVVLNSDASPSVLRTETL